MEIASQKLLGVHDFRNFCKMDVGNGVTEFIRNIYEINVEPTADDSDGNIQIPFFCSIKFNVFFRVFNICNKN